VVLRRHETAHNAAVEVDLPDGQRRGIGRRQAHDRRRIGIDGRSSDEYNGCMPSLDSKPSVLTVHPSTPNEAVRSLEVWVRAEKSDILVFHYSLAADMSRVRVPPSGVGRPADALWKHTCFEAFVAAADAPGVEAPGVDAPGVEAPGVEAPGVEAPGYHEFNFSPSRDWAIYRFGAYREGMSRAEMDRAPEISIRRCDGGLELESRVSLGQLADLRDARRLRVAMAAVIEDDGGGLSYWGLRHAPGKPDFHHPNGFTLEVARS
jgi:hypothetical protein